MMLKLTEHVEITISLLHKQKKKNKQTNKQTKTKTKTKNPVKFWYSELS